MKSVHSVMLMAVLLLNHPSYLILSKLWLFTLDQLFGTIEAMTKTSRALIFGLGIFVGACSTSNDTQTAQTGEAPKVDRAPATVTSTPVRTSVAVGRSPFVSSHTATPVAPTSPAANPAQPLEAQASCSMRLDQLEIGTTPIHTGAFSVTDVLFRAQTWNAITGYDMQDYDRPLLAPWFSTQLNGPGTELFAAAKDSCAFSRAMYFIWGNTPVNCPKDTNAWRDTYTNRRMAAILASMIAVAKQPSHDPECLRWVRQYADKMLGAQHKGELNELPFVQAMDKLKDPAKFQDAFAEIVANRNAIEKDLKNLDKVIADKEKKAVSEKKKLDRDLDASYQKFKRELRAIPGCQNVVSFTILTDSSGTPDKKAQADKLVDECKTKLEKRIAKLHDQEGTLLEQYDAEVAKEQEKNTDMYGPIQETAAQVRINQQLQVKRDEIAKMLKFEDMLDLRENSSVLSQIEKIDSIIAAASKIETGEFVKPEQEKKAELQQQLGTTSPQWLTYGFLGGFSLDLRRPATKR